MNNKIIEEFEGLVKQIDYDLNNAKTNPEKNKHLFRLRQIKNALKIIKNYKKKIERGEDLKDIKGIGKGIIKRIDEIIKKGYLAEVSLSNKKKKLNKAVEELEKVINIGRKTAIKFASQGITSVEALKKAIKSGKIEVNDEIKLGIKYYGKYDTEIPRTEIDKVNVYLQRIVKKIDDDLELVICGSYRRRKKISHDIDLLIIHKSVKKIKDIENNDDNYLIKLVNKLKKDLFLIDDITYKNYITKYMGFSQLRSSRKTYPIRRIDIRFFPYDSYYTALLYFTGSGETNKQMRQRAIELGYKLNEYGLYKIDGNKQKRIKIKSEKDVFDNLDMEYLEPWER